MCRTRALLCIVSITKRKDAMCVTKKRNKRVDFLAALFYRMTWKSGKSGIIGEFQST